MNTKQLIILVFFYFYPLMSPFAQCPDDWVILNSQDDLDQFVADYPDCALLDKTVSILESDIVSLELLSGLQRVGGLVINGNSSLLSLEGLHNITSCGFLKIESNEQLHDLTGLRSLVFTNGLTVNNNKNLVNLDGLDNVIEAHSLTYIQNNPRLKDISAIENIQKWQGLWLIGNDSVRQLPKFYNLDNSRTSTTIISDNPMLVSLEGLDSLKTFGRIDIINNDRLKSLHGMQNLTMNSGVWLDISGNDSLQTLDGLQGLDTIMENSVLDVHGNFFIRDNAQLTSLEGLENLRFVSKDLIIENNPLLSSLDGLVGLNYVGESLIISNTNLTSLSGLDSLDAESFELLQVTDSPMLSSCAVRSICDAIFIGANVVVDGNDEGCNTIEEIDAQCITSTSQSDLTHITIYPNPASDYFLIEGMMDQDVTIEIIDQLGRVVQVVDDSKQVNITTIQSGIYYLTFTAKNQKSTLKFVKL